jgi:hypothetical protein
VWVKRSSVTRVSGVQSLLKGTFFSALLLLFENKKGVKEKEEAGK